MRTTLLSCASAVLLLGVVSNLAAASIGDKAPPFSVKDITGKVHTLEDYQGKIIVLEAYNLDCPYCRNHYVTGAMQDLQKELTAQGVIWLAVNSTSRSNPGYRTPEAAQKEWSAQKNRATAMLDDEAGVIGKSYGMRTTPHMFVVDARGNLAYDGAIDDRPSPSGDPRTARNYVRAAVQQLQAGEAVKTTKTKPYGCGVKY